MSRLHVVPRQDTGRRRSVLAQRPLRLESLEARAMLTVTWDGGGDGVNWTDPLNWDTDSKPTSADDVVIGAANVVVATGLNQIQSITSGGDLSVTGGTLRVTAGVSSVSGALTITGGFLQAVGATATFVADGMVSLTGGSFYALSGGQLDLSNAASLVDSNAYFRADGAGSTIDLSGVAAITGIQGIRVNATPGGSVDLSAVTTITAPDTDVTADGSDSTVNLTSLANWNDATNLGSLTVSNSGNADLTLGTLSLAGIAVSSQSLGTINGGTLQFEAGSQLSGNGGTVNANVSNLTGLVAPGNTAPNPGTASVVGDFSQAAAGSLAVQINGPTAGSGYDQLIVQGTVSLDGTLTISRNYTPTIGESWTIIDNDGADPVAGTFELSPEGDIYTVGGLPFQLSYVGGDGNDVTLTRVENVVVGRHIFYNESKFDGGNSGPNAADDDAIAPDKVPLFPGGGTATFANITSYSRGINGIMVDLSGPHGAISASDFTFVMSNQAGANNTPSTWVAAPAPTSVSVRSGAGYRGADRIEIVWAAGAISNRWLQILSQGDDTAGGNNTNTGLPASDLFYFGNRIGDTGSGTATLAITSALDEIAARNNAGFGASVTNLFDFDRSGLVSAVDNLIARNNAGTLTKISLTDPPAAPVESSPVVDGTIAWALTAPKVMGTNAVARIPAGAGVGPWAAAVPRSADHPEDRAIVAPSHTRAETVLDLAIRDMIFERLISDDLLDNLDHEGF